MGVRIAKYWVICALQRLQSTSCDWVRSTKRRGARTLTSGDKECLVHRAKENHTGEGTYKGGYVNLKKIRDSR